MCDITHTHKPRADEIVSTLEQSIRDCKANPPPHSVDDLTDMAVIELSTGLGIPCAGDCVKAYAQEWARGFYHRQPQRQLELAL